MRKSGYLVLIAMVFWAIAFTHQTAADHLNLVFVAFAQLLFAIYFRIGEK